MNYKEYVLFKSANETYGIDINNVENIEKHIEITRVPYTKSYIQGIINLRGNIIPVINVRKRMNLCHMEINANTRIMIVRYNETSVGLLVDESSEVIQINDQDIELAPKVLDSQEDFIENIGKDNGRIIMLLNLGKLLDVVSEEN